MQLDAVKIQCNMIALQNHEWFEMQSSSSDSSGLKLVCCGHKLKKMPHKSDWRVKLLSNVCCLCSCFFLLKSILLSFFRNFLWKSDKSWGKLLIYEIFHQTVKLCCVIFFLFCGWIFFFCHSFAKFTCHLHTTFDQQVLLNPSWDV